MDCLFRLSKFFIVVFVDGVGGGGVIFVWDLECVVLFFVGWGWGWVICVLGLVGVVVLGWDLEVRRVGVEVDDEVLVVNGDGFGLFFILLVCEGFGLVFLEMFWECCNWWDVCVDVVVFEIYFVIDGD